MAATGVEPGGHPAEAAERHWNSWQELARENGYPLPQAPAFVAALKQVWEASEYVALSCLQQPQLFADLLKSGDLQRSFASGRLEEVLVALLEEAEDEQHLSAILRRFRRYQMVRIIWRDLAGWAPLGETLEDLSALADACISEALGRLYAWHCEKSGVPRDEDGVRQHLVVLGMGKLGARELNLSSDIDLIFAYPRSGETDGQRPLANEQFFTRVAQKLVQVLNNQTADGFVFRVDMRLRPYGDAGPLAMSFEAMEAYYQDQGREWERYAMIKARMVAGDTESGGSLLEMLRPFVYRRYLDFGAIESLRDLKVLISRELRRKGMADNIKLGPGGIREIEFIGQVFQLIRGGREPDLQVRPILEVLKRLGAKGYLPEYVVVELTEAYVFLRCLENRLQAWADRQTHVLPDDDAARLRLARAMGFSRWPDLRQRLDDHRQRTQGHFDKVFAAPQADPGDSQAGMAALWQGELANEQALEILAGLGFSDPETALGRIDGLRNSPTCQALGARGRKRLDQLMPLLIEEVAASDAPDIALQRLLKLVEAIARRTAYLALLVESPIAVSQLVRLSAISPWIADALTRQPLLLDELLDPRRLYAPLHKVGLAAELTIQLERLAPDDLELQMDRLRQFAQGNRLRVASADITGAIALMVVSDYLTDIAEVVVQEVLAIAWRHLAGRHGSPTGIFGADIGFAVVGYGKLGGIELGYGSDLDLVFLHGSADAMAMTDGAKPISNDLFYARLGQRMIHMLTTRTPSGILYEVDMRLRPNGASGMLVSSLDAYADYQAQAAWTWEHQALVRARVVAGDPQVRVRFEQIRRDILTRERDPDVLRKDVVDMRERMRGQLQKKQDGCFDLKQGPGGIADIEFMVQYAVLRWANGHPGLVDFTDNVRLLEGLAGSALIPGDTADTLADAYRALRAAYHRSVLQDQSALIGDQELLVEREQVKQVWSHLMVTDG